MSNALRSTEESESPLPEIVPVTPQDDTTHGLPAFDNAAEELPPPPSPSAKIACEIAARVLENTAVPSESVELPAVAGYQILDRLGRGGMGIVYKARQVKLNRVVALKMILAGAQAESRELTRFRTEVEAIARLQHPNIVQILEAGEQNGCPYYVLEFVDGGSLADKLGGKPQPAHATAELMETIALAVHFAHQHGIVHRDLKPSNVLVQKRAAVPDQVSDRTVEKSAPTDLCPLTSDLFPKISDFGLAKQLRPAPPGPELEAQRGETLTGEVMGTPSYMAPEQIDCKQKVGPAADIYALGAILYEMLTGRQPFLGVTPLETLRQVQDDEPVPPSRLQSKVPRDLDTICLKCLQKDPNKRYADAGQVAADLRRFLGGEPIAARPVTLWERAYKWSKRRPAWTALIAVSCIAALLLAAGGWWSYVKVSGLAREMSWQARRAERNAQIADIQRIAAEQREFEASRLSEQLDAQRQLADANLRQLGSVIDRMIEFGDKLHQVESKRFVDTSDQGGNAERNSDSLTTSASMEDVIKDMQASARRFYEQFVQQTSDDPEVQAEKGRAFRRLAGIINQTGRKSEAAEQCAQAIEIFTELTSSHPESAAYAQELVLSCRQAASIYADIQPNRKKAVELLLRALEVQERLVHDHPQHTAYVTELASTCLSLGSNLCDRFEFQKAEHLLNRSLELWQRLSVEQPGVIGYRRSVAATQSTLGRLYRFWKRWDRAEALYHLALQSRQAMLSDKTADHELQNDVADTQFWLAGMYYATDRLDEADEHFQAALAIQKELHRAEPARTSFAVALGRTHSYLGSVLRDRGDAEASLAHYGEAIELLKSGPERQHNRAALFLAAVYIERSESLARLGRRSESEQDWRQAFSIDPSRWWGNQLERAEKLARAGQHTLATDKVVRLAKETQSNDKSVARTRYFNMAAIYALSIHAANRDENLAEGEREKLVELYSGQALRHLEQAREVGLFKDATKLDQLRNDAMFESLRSSDAFQKLLNELPNASTH